MDGLGRGQTHRRPRPDIVLASARHSSWAIISGAPRARTRLKWEPILIVPCVRAPRNCLLSRRTKHIFQSGRRRVCLSGNGRELGGRGAARRPIGIDRRCRRSRSISASYSHISQALYLSTNRGSSDGQTRRTRTMAAGKEIVQGPGGGSPLARV